MASIRTQESIPTLTRASTTTATFGASRINIGAQQYATTSALTLNTAVIGASGLDASIQASKIYYVYLVLNSGVPTLIGSLSNTGPSGFAQSRIVGCFYSNASSQILWASKNPQVISTAFLVSGTYTPQIGCITARVRMNGAGGGGGGSNTGGGTPAGTGGSTIFGTLTALGGGGGNNPGGTPGGGSGSGGTGTIFATNGTSGPGNGGNNSSGASSYGGGGGSTFFGPGAIGGTNGGGSAGSPAAANTGAGGGGGGGNGTQNAGVGGAGGDYLEAIIPNPTTTAFTIGTGGTAGSNATNGSAGGSGILVIDETLATII